MKRSFFKSLALVSILIVIILGCASAKNQNLEIAQQSQDTIRIANDSLDYEIIIIEPGFNTWLLQQRLKGFYEQFWLKNRNIIMVNQFNLRVADPVRFSTLIYQQPIE